VGIVFGDVADESCGVCGEGVDEGCWGWWVDGEEGLAGKRDGGHLC
jgi:hypothetical protein